MDDEGNAERPRRRKSWFEVMQEDYDSMMNDY
jgi:hypothetical protein